MTYDDEPAIDDETDLPDIPSPEQVGAWVEQSFQAGTFDLATEFGMAKRAKERAERARERPHRELPSWIDPHSLRQAGWGVVVPWNRQIFLDWLRPLLRRRETQSGPGMYREYKLQRGQSAEAFLRSQLETPGTIDPKKVPYYLLLVGSPREISFEFQYHLSLSRAVGRVWFPDRDGYRKYAEAIRLAEMEGVERPRKVSVFSVENDSTTSAIGKTLVPSVQRLIDDGFPNWEVEVVRRDEAVKSRLGSLLGGGKTPGLLLVSSHGRNTLDESSRDLLQGALLCEPGEGTRPEDLPVLYSAADLVEEPLDLNGLISCFFACNSAGTPVLDSFPHVGKGPEAALETAPKIHAGEPLIARLPVELLSRGALAVLGHIDRGWSTSFVWSFESGDIGTLYSFEDMLNQLLRGQRLGHAMRPLNRRYSQLASRLAQMLDQQRIGAQQDLTWLGFYWTAVNDARNFIILGDPAVYLRGHRPEEVKIRLDLRQLERIERIALGRRMTAEDWIRTTLESHL